MFVVFCPSLKFNFLFIGHTHIHLVFLLPTRIVTIFSRPTFSSYRVFVRVTLLPIFFSSYFLPPLSSFAHFLLLLLLLLLRFFFVSRILVYTLSFHTRKRLTFLHTVHRTLLLLGKKLPTATEDERRKCCKLTREEGEEEEKKVEWKKWKREGEDTG